MSASIRQLSASFSPRVFAMGLGGVVAVYAGLFGYAAVSGDNTIERLERNLASITVMLETPHGVVEAEAIPEQPEPETVTAQSGVVKQVEDHRRPQAIEVPAPIEKAEVKATMVAPAPQDDGLSISDILQADNVLKAKKGLRKAPLSVITEDTPQGLVPIKVAGEPSAFEAYKKPFILNRSKHAVAVVITHYGLSESLSADVLKAMPSPVSLILSPYALRAEHWQEQARADGHELWLDLPLQTLDFPRRDPGPKALLTDASLAYNEERLEWALSRTSGYAGLAGYTDTVLTRSTPMFNGFFDQIFNRGLGFLELNDGGSAFSTGVAAQKNAPYASSALSLKSFVAGSDEIKRAEAMITRNPHTVIVAQPSAQNLDDLKAWLMRLEQSGVVIAPASALANLAVK